MRAALIYRFLLFSSLALTVSWSPTALCEDEAAAVAAARAKATKQGRARLEKNVTKAVAKVADVAKGGVIALLRTKPVLEDDLPSEVSAQIDALLQRALLLGGVLANDVEALDPIPAVYAKGKLSPKSRIDAKQRGRLHAEVRAACSLEAMWLLADGRYEIRLRLRELERGATKARWSLSKIDTRKAPLADIISIRPLPAANVAILLFAIRMLGKRVARGECWDVPGQPLMERGFKPSGYNFGRRIAFAEALPGDVVTIDARGHQHVMVLWQKRKTQGASSILHQNWDGKRHVMVMGYPSHMVADSIIWRPPS